MNKQEKIDLLKTTLTHLKKLDKDKFDYSSWVSKTDKEKTCGTVCCVGGWYPVWYKKEGFFYQEYLGDVFPHRLSFSNACDFTDILEDFHQLSTKTILILFLGDFHLKKHLHKQSKFIVENHQERDLAFVIQLWEEVISFIEQDLLN